VRQHRGNPEPHGRNRRFDDPVGADDEAADAEPQHEHRDDDGGGIDGVAEDVAEDADPDDLVDEAAEAGQEEEEIDQTNSQLPNSQLPNGPCRDGSWKLGLGS